MASSAPVCSPTPIICTTIGGKTPVSLSGWATVSPLSTPLRTAMIASSTIALPAVRAVISSPSRIGTPEAIKVESVRQKRATAIFCISVPKIGAFRITLSTTRRPP